MSVFLTAAKPKSPPPLILPALWRFCRWRNASGWRMGALYLFLNYGALRVLVIPPPCSFVIFFSSCTHSFAPISMRYMKMIVWSGCHGCSNSDTIDRIVVTVQRPTASLQVASMPCLVAPCPLPYPLFLSFSLVLGPRQRGHLDVWPASDGPRKRQ